MPHHILILDDEPISLKFMTRILETLGNPDIILHPCAHASEALAVAAANPPDIVLTDIKMPEIDGVSLLAKFKKDGLSSLFIMVSAFANKAVALDSLRLGAFDFIEKPVQKDLLLAAVKKALDLIHLRQELSEAQAKSIESERLASLGLMAGNIAHEISTPLTIMNSITDDYFKDPSKFNAQESMLQIQKMHERISKIVKSLKNLAWAGDSNLPEPVKIATIFEDLVNLSHLRLKNKGIRLDLKLPADSLEIVCDRIGLSQVMLNLVNNAIDAIEALKERWIKVTVERKDPLLLVTITDSGSGINEEIRHKIFEAFFTTKKIGKGVGLGLSNAQRVILQHEGKLTIDANNPNTTFVIELPLHPSYAKR